MTEPVVKRSLAELDTVIEEIVQRNPEWYEEIQQLIEKLKNERTN
jgi:FtsZ-interacting cell division protein YlmF